MKRHRYIEIDALRGIAAVIVLVYHLFDADQISPSFHGGFDGWAELIPTTIFNGTGATVLFFVISGFVLAEGTRASLDPRYVASFAIRRTFRIMPGVWASIALALALGASIAPGKFTSALLLGSEATQINGPLWSLQVEMIASAVFPLLLYASIRGGLMAQAIMLCGLMYVEITGARLPWSWMFLFSFQLGIMVHSSAEGVREMLPVLRRISVVLGIGALMLSTNLDRLGFITERAHIMFAGVGSFILVNYVVSGTSPLVSFLQRPLPQFFGKISYSLYLFNLLIVRSIGQAISPAVMHITAGWAIGRPLIQHCVTGILAVPICIIAAWLGWRLVEDPFHRLGRYLGRIVIRARHDTATTAAAVVS